MQCKKSEILKQDYGRDDLLPLWIADMDFAVCPEITEALAHLAKKHSVIAFSDEIFGDLMLYGHKHTPIATVGEEAAVKELK